MDGETLIETEKSVYDVKVNRRKGYLAGDKGSKIQLYRDGRKIEEWSSINEYNENKFKQDYHIVVESIKQIRFYDKSPIVTLEVGDTIIRNPNETYMIYPSQQNYKWEIYRIGSKKVSFIGSDYEIQDKLDEIDEEVIQFGERRWNY